MVRIDWNVSVSNLTPHPLEEITISGSVAKESGLWTTPIKVRLMLDSREIKRVEAYELIDPEYVYARGGKFRIPLGVSPVPGPYTYWLEVSDKWESAWDRNPNPISIEVVPEFVCPWCGATFPSEGSLETHKLTCPSRPAFACPWCGVAFATQEELDAHKLVCPSRPAFACPWCGIGFATQEELDAHKLVCPKRPKEEIPWKKYLLYGAAGLSGIGLIWYAVSGG